MGPHRASNVVGAIMGATHAMRNRVKNQQVYSSSVKTCVSNNVLPRSAQAEAQAGLSWLDSQLIPPRVFSRPQVTKNA